MVARPFTSLLWFGIAGLSILPSRMTGQSVAAGNRAERVERSAVVTINVDTMPLKYVVQVIARQAGLTPVYGPAVANHAARVTLHVRELGVMDAFEQALRGTNLVASIESDKVLIARRDPNANAIVASAVTGQVTDGRKAVAGATVTLERTKFSTRTGEDGAFRLIDVPAGSYTMTIRRLGYSVVRKAITVTDNVSAPIDVVLAAASTPLEEVVTTVTGPQRRLEVGNSIGVIKADSLVREAPIMSVSQLLTARVPGLIVSQAQGTVGGNVKLQIRGLTSLTLSSEPIVIVDGMRYTSRAGTFSSAWRDPVSPLNDLNPNDIETVEVVKGPSAATLYGTDAANGVVVITTKRGKAGPPRWTAFARGVTDEIPTTRAKDLYYGWASSFNGVAGTVRYCALEYVALNLCTQDSVTHQPKLLDDKEISIFQPARSFEYGAGLSGGQQTLRYAFSGAYNNQEGAVALPPVVNRAIKAQGGKASDELLHPNVQTLLNLRSNVTVALGPKLEFDVSGGYIRGYTRNIKFGFEPFLEGVATSVVDSTWYANELRNFFARTSGEDNNRFLTSANGRAHVTPWLTARATAGVDAATRDGHDLIPPDATRFLEPEGYANESRTHQVATSADAGVTATVRNGWVSARTSIGAQYVRNLEDALVTNGRTLPPGTTDISQAAQLISYRLHNETVSLGNYVEETVGLNERLFLTGALRVDGASTFGKGYSATTYPKLSASWLVSEEPFIPRVPGLDEFRLRTAYGVSGRQPQPGWALPTYIVETLPAEAGGQRPVVVNALGNADLRPERGREFEMGVDAGALNRRLVLELTWYRRQTFDQILSQSRPAGLGFHYTNVGLTREHGFESQVTATLIDTRPVHWTMTLQHTSRDTKLVRLGSAKSVRTNDGGYAQGYPLGARFITPLLGYADADGDGTISRNEVQLGDTAVYAGVNRPPRTQTLTTTLGLFQQKLRFSALFDRQSGGTIVNDFVDACQWCRVRYDRTAPLVLQAYNAAREVYKPGLPGFRLVERGNFTRLREVTTTLTLPAQFVRAMHVTSSSLSLSARNLALWSRFSGLDPESAGISSGFAQLSQAAAIGIPQSRTWVLRCDIGL